MNNSQTSAPVWIDYSGGVSRFSGCEALYRKYLAKFPDDPTFAQLQQALASGDRQDAFRRAHTLKGCAGNLSLTALYQALVPFVERLRAQDDAPLEGWEEIEAFYAETLRAIRILLPSV